MELRIDGRKVEAEPGMTILQAARRAGIHIPTLCYHEALSPYGACRVCLVELRREGRSRLVTACNYPVEEAEGAEVLTASERVLRNRRMVVEMLLFRCPHVRVVQDLARQVGIERPRFEPEDPAEDCVLCGLCVRACREIVGVEAIELVDRGVHTRVRPPFEQPPQSCIGCGSCAYVCPTGHIRLEERDGVRVIWNLSLIHI